MKTKRIVALAVVILILAWASRGLVPDGRDPAGGETEVAREEPERVSSLAVVTPSEAAPSAVPEEGSPLVRAAAEGNRPVWPTPPPASWVLGGQILDGYADPVPSVRVFLEVSGSPFGSTTSNAAGGFSFAALPPGSYTLRAALPGGPERFLKVACGPEGGTRTVEFLLTARTLRVHVVDSTGHSISSVAVRACAKGQPHWTTWAWTDAQGIATLGTWEGRLVEVSAHPEKWLAERYWAPSAVDVHQDAAETTIRLALGRTIAGRAIGPSGRPIALARVTALRCGELVGWALSGSGSRQGWFEIVVPLDVPVDLKLEGDRSEPWEGTCGDVMPGASDVELRAQQLPEDRTLQVVLRHPDGSAAITAVQAMIMATLSLHTSDERGLLSFRGLPPRPVRLLALAGRDAWGRTWPTQCLGEFVPDGQTAVLTLESGLPLDGRVVSADGTPVPRAAVFVAYGVDYDVEYLADERGEFRIFVVPSSFPLALRATRPGSKAAAILDLAAPPDDTITLRLPPHR